MLNCDTKRLEVENQNSCCQLNFRNGRETRQKRAAASCRKSENGRFRFDST